MARDDPDDVKAEVGARLYASVHELVSSLIEFDYWGELQDDELRDLLDAMESLNESTAVSLFEAIARQGSEIVRDLEGDQPAGG